jgi:hypothetical protein
VEGVPSSSGRCSIFAINVLLLRMTMINTITKKRKNRIKEITGYISIFPIDVM